MSATTAQVIPLPLPTLSKREKTQQKLNVLLTELQTYYGDSVTGFVDDVSRAANGKTGLQGALLQIEWIESELEEYQALDTED